MAKKKAKKEAAPVESQQAGQVNLPQEHPQAPPDHDPYRNRIVGYDNLPPEEVVANDANWREHPKSQRDMLDKNLRNIGWVQDVIVNKQTGHLVDGHLRLSIALESKLPSIPVKYVDLTLEEERRVLATLDPIGAMATTNQDKLDELLGEVNKDLETLDQRLKEEVSQSMEAITDYTELLNKTNTIHAIKPQVIRNPYYEPEKEEDENDLETVPDQISPAIAIEMPDHWELGVTPYDIPPLKPDMLCDCPEPIHCWTTPSDCESLIETHNFLTVAGNGNLRGLPWHKTILCTHTVDEVLDMMWADAASYTRRLLNRQPYGAMTPEYSVGCNWPKAERIWNIYRNRFMGRMWQEVGIKVIPTISHLFDVNDTPFYYAGVPKNAPCVSVQMQANTRYGKHDDEQNIATYRQSLKHLIKNLSPQSLIIYGGPKRDEYLNFITLPDSLHVILVNNFMANRSASLKKIVEAQI